MLLWGYFVVVRFAATRVFIVVVQVSSRSFAAVIGTAAAAVASHRPQEALARVDPAHNVFEKVKVARDGRIRHAANRQKGRHVALARAAGCCLVGPAAGEGTRPPVASGTLVEDLLLAALLAQCEFLLRVSRFWLFVVQRHHHGAC